MSIILWIERQASAPSTTVRRCRIDGGILVCVALSALHDTTGIRHILSSGWSMNYFSCLESRRTKIDYLYYVLYVVCMLNDYLVHRLDRMNWMK